MENTNQVNGEEVKMGKRINFMEQQIADLQREKEELYSGSPIAYHLFGNVLKTCTNERYTGSGVILSIKPLGKDKKTLSVLIRDGFSIATINAILADLRASYELATSYKPVGDVENTN